MKLNQFLNLLNEEIIKTKLRKYTSDEINNEINEVIETSDNIYPEKIKTEIIDKLKLYCKQPLIETIKYINLNTDVENTEAFEQNINVEKIEKYYKDDKEYIERFKSILEATEIPPPIIVNYNDKNRLIGGNRRAVKLAIEANKLSKKAIPVILIKI